jgi:hypothetical protein
VKTEEKEEKKEVKPCGTMWLKKRNSNNEKIKKDQITTLNKGGKSG